jgi:hypothetical protein
VFKKIFNNITNDGIKIAIRYIDLLLLKTEKPERIFGSLWLITYSTREHFQNSGEN